MESKVRVTVKAANGAVADFTVDAERGWSVQRLKNHLYRHYPTHPVSCCRRKRVGEGRDIGWVATRLKITAVATTYCMCMCMYSETISWLEPAGRLGHLASVNL